ncbi:glycoside hydrolase family 3 C-terminal domain-containing protein [Streptomyces wuyuanensis]|uniref:glycoside hydrolase family 3 C-terminal domain-containing protein n=1 Tax=Streptomyces wuyuanensis TaxID=1196353 RepID=UPI003D750A38
MVLLQNDDSVLPPDRDAREIAIVEPLADWTDLHGMWAGRARTGSISVSVLDAVRAAAPGARVTHAGEDLAEAVTAAGSADVIVVVVGEPPALSGEAAVRQRDRSACGPAGVGRGRRGDGRPFAVVLSTTGR